MNGRTFLYRDNPQGRRYSLHKISDEKTRIVTGTKAIEVNMSIDNLSARWFLWQMQGKLIQNAFPELSAGEREFLITGITPEEWNELFSEEN